MERLIADNYYIFAVDLSHAKAISRKQKIPDSRVRYIDYPWRFGSVEGKGKIFHVSCHACKAKREEYEEVVIKAIQLGFKLEFIKD